jgi:hypothetical protein
MGRNPPPPSAQVILAPGRNPGYGPKPLPSTRDGQIRDLVLGAVGDPAAFERFTAHLPHRADRALTAFAERSASLAVRRGDPVDVRAGLLAAVAACQVTDDVREVIPAFALLYRAAELIGADPSVEFGTAARRVPLAFLERGPRERSIQVMAYEETEDEQGFRFRRTW